MQPSRALVEAYYFGSPRRISGKILFIKRAERLAEYATHLTDLEQFGHVWHGITGKLHSKFVTVIATGVGPSLVGDALYALSIPGATCLYSGTCGGLRDGLAVGDTFVAEAAVCGEGYASGFGHAPFSLVRGDPDVLQDLKVALAAAGARFAAGVTYTTSSVVRENDPDFWCGVGQQCQVIEMGAAAFYAAALAGGQCAAAYFWVTDLPTRGKSFFDPLPSADMQIKAERYRRAVAVDLALLAAV